MHRTEVSRWLTALGATLTAACGHESAPPSARTPTASVRRADVTANANDAPPIADNAPSPYADAPRKEPTKEKDDRRTALAQAAFDETQAKQKGSPQRSWDMALTPVVPAVWPPDGKVTAYVYARGRGAQLADGEYISAPFARVVSADNAPDRLESLSSVLVDLGTQGMRPMTKEELDTPYPTNLEPLVRRLSSQRHVEAPAPADLRASYCQWKRLNGVIAERVVAAHPGFFRWLACGR